jgi:hypothetical protein
MLFDAYHFRVGGYNLLVFLHNSCCTLFEKIGSRFTHFDFAKNINNKEFNFTDEFLINVILNIKIASFCDYIAQQSFCVIKIIQSRKTKDTIFNDTANNEKSNFTA